MSYYKDWYDNPTYAPSKKKVKDNWKTFGNWGGYWRDSDTQWLPIKRVEDEEDPRTELENKRKEECKRSLSHIGRSANVILSSVNQETSMKVKFSSGRDVNSHGDSTIYISPDKILAATSDEKRGEILDSLCGEVMLAAHIRRQVPLAVVKSLNLTRKQGVRVLFSSIETAVARNSVSQEWEGFKPYFDAYSDTQVEGEYENIKNLVAENDGNDGRPTSSRAFIKAVSWNLYHVNHPIAIPEVYGKAKSIIKEGLSCAETSADRLEMCRSAVYRIEKLYDIKEEDTGEDPTEKKKSDWEDSSDGMAGSLFGKSAPVKNALLPEASALGDTSEDDDVSCPVKFTGSTSEMLEIGDRTLPIWCAPDSGATVYSESDLRGFAIKAESLASFMNISGVSDTGKAYNTSYGKINTRALHHLLEEEGSDNEDKAFYSKREDTSDQSSVCILVDQSGSMESRTDGKPRIEAAREIGYIVSKACQYSNNIDLSIIGFSAQESSPSARKLGVAGKGEVNLRLVYDSRSGDDIKAILSMRAHANNIDGFSIWYAAQKMSENKKHYNKKIIIVISDGAPCANGYQGDAAIDHVGRSIADVRSRFNTAVYGIGACSAFSEDKGNRMYGKSNFVIVPGMSKVMRPISRLISRLA